MAPAKLSQTDPGIAWLRQFDVADQGDASALLDGIALVSPLELTDRLRTLILDRASSVGGIVGLYAERELRRYKGTPNRLFKEPRRKPRRAYGAVDAVRPLRADSPQVGSEGLIAQLIAELARQYPTRFRSHPAPNRIRRDRVRAFFVVTDFIGSGRRVCTFLDGAWRVASVRSWRSFGWLQFAAIAYAGTELGVQRVSRHRCRPDVGLVVPSPTIDTVFDGRTAARVRWLCIKYDPGTRDPKEALGYGGTGALIAFAHSCPNNAPRVLHATGRAGWTPIFPTGVTEATRGIFGERRDIETIAARIARLGETRLSRGDWIDEATEEGRLMVALLAALVRTPRTDRVLAARTGLTLPEVALYLERAEAAGWVGTSRRLTDEGRGELQHARTYSAPRAFQLPPEPTEPYYPTSLRTS
jgi:hypothetical protein